MILTICRWARWLDEWLQRRLGRPYSVVLGIGLVSEIVDQFVRLPSRLHSAPTLVRAVLIIFIEFALLLHLIGGLAHHIERRRASRGNGAAPPA
jgi:hypothetical protein